MATKILVGYNGTSEAEDALCLAKGLAAITGAVLELADVESGSPARALQEMAEADSVAFIVVGSSHRGRVGAVLAGTVGVQLLQGAPCPVAVAPRGLADAGQWRPATIGVAYDGSPEARTALDEAHALAHNARAGLKVIAVAEPASTPQESVDPDAFELASTVHAQKCLQAAIDELGAEFTVVTRMAVGEPGPELLAVTEGLDLLVLGSHGYGPVRRALLGSVASYLIERCRCPLLVTSRGSHVSADSGEMAAAHVLL